MAKMNAAIFLCAGLCLSGCGATINNPPLPDDTIFVKDARLTSPRNLPAVSLSIVKTAEFKTLEGLFFSGGRWFTPRIGVHAAVLVKHPQGTFLFDIGLGEDVDRQFADSMPFWLKPFMAYDHHHSAKALLANEIKSAPVQRIILSHLHWDHASGIKDFPRAEVWTTQQEYEWAMSSAAAEGIYIKSQYSGKDIKWRFIQFEHAAYENFDQHFDLFGDGSVVLVPLPGHTPGSIGMFVNLSSGKRLFFTGDTTWTLEGFRLPAHKFCIASLLVDHDKHETERSILKVHSLMDAYPAMIIVPAHDDQAQRAIGFFPQFIR